DVAKLVDARDLKSLDLWSYGFDSRRPHHGFRTRGAYQKPDAGFPNLQATRVQEKSSVESFFRALTVAGSIGPQASKNCSNCLRAPSSFQARSRLMMASSSAAASSRRFWALRRIAKSNRA